MSKNETNEPTKSVLARRRCAARHRIKTQTEGRRVDVKLGTVPAAALAAIEKRTGESATGIITRLILADAGP